MQCKTEKGKYHILYDGDDHITKISKPALDKSLKRITTALGVIQVELKVAYEKDYERYALLRSYIFEAAGLRVDQTSCQEIGNALDDAKQLRNYLDTADDEITTPEARKRLITLESLGYKRDYPYRDMRWEKKIEDTDEREVVEEVILADEPIRRIRTIEWDIVPGGKSSRSIKYRKLKVPKRLLAAIENELEGAYR